MKGNLVPRGIGRRVTKRTIKRQKPNLRTVRLAINGDNKTTLRLCASCVKTLKREKKAAVEEVAVKSEE